MSVLVVGCSEVVEEPIIWDEDPVEPYDPEEECPRGAQDCDWYENENPEPKIADQNPEPESSLFRKQFKDDVRYSCDDWKDGILEPCPRGNGVTTLDIWPVIYDRQWIDDVFLFSGKDVVETFEELFPDWGTTHSCREVKSALNSPAIHNLDYIILESYPGIMDGKFEYKEGNEWKEYSFQVTCI